VLGVVSHGKLPIRKVPVLLLDPDVSYSDTLGFSQTLK
jgi:hypothetical protein